MIKEYPFVKDKKHIIPYLFAKQNLVLPLEEKDERLVAAIHDPMNFLAQKELSLLLDKEVVFITCSKEEIEDAIELCYHQKEDETKTLFASINKDAIALENREEGYDLLEQSADSPVIKMLNAIIKGAIQESASDIHFEPMEDGLILRYRIDGVLQKRESPPPSFALQIITRIKVMAKLDIAEKRLPQDGRIKLRMGARDIDFRVSTMPVIYGERVALRILDKGNLLLGLDKLGMSSEILKEFRLLSQVSEGLVLVTGPTGSGKTTTLYSAVGEINSSEVNVMTIEDPVEYKLSSVAQIAVNPKIKLTFATGLRHILRQDPDVIMVGEIRDRETAEIAIHSSLTGHLVLSTLHTNDAPAALTRLVDMGIEPYLLSSSVVGVLAQRLVRKICPECKEEHTLSSVEKGALGLKKQKFFKGRGCSFCFNTGYKGRIGIYELMKVTAKIRQQIAKGVDAAELRKVALEEKMPSLLASGAHLVEEGVTTPFEVLRVVSVKD